MGYANYLPGVQADCPWLPFEYTPGVCNRCGTTLTGRQSQWCSQRCQFEWRQQHDWALARDAAKVRDCRMCQDCGAVEQYDWRDPAARVRLEVNHIVPRVGRGYGFGCHNHLINLETLCPGPTPTCGRRDDRRAPPPDAPPCCGPGRTVRAGP